MKNFLSLILAVGASLSFIDAGNQNIGSIHGTGHTIAGTQYIIKYDNNGHVYLSTVQHGGTYNNGRRKRAASPDGNQVVGTIDGNGHLIVGEQNSYNYNNNGHVYNGAVQNGGVYNNGRKKRSPAPETYIGQLGASNTRVIGSVSSQDYYGHRQVVTSGQFNVLNRQQENSDYYNQNKKAKRSADTVIGHIGGVGKTIIGNSYAYTNGFSGDTKGPSGSGTGTSSQLNGHIYNGPVYSRGVYNDYTRAKRAASPGDQHVGSIHGNNHEIVGTKYHHSYNNNGHVYNGNVEYGGEYNNNGRRKRSPGNQVIGKIDGAGHLIVGTQSSQTYGQNGHVYLGSVGNGGSYNNRGKRSPGNQIVGKIDGYNHEIVGTKYHHSYNNNGHVYNGHVGHGGIYNNNRGKRMASPDNIFIGGAGSSVRVNEGPFGDSISVSSGGSGVYVQESPYGDTIVLH